MKSVFYVYSKEGCHLCEELIEELIELVRGQASIDVIDINESIELFEKYREEIPVVEFGGCILFKHYLDKSLVNKALRS
jgi:hypothetical protein